MKDTFHNFEDWLITNLNKKPSRAEELASRLRTIERSLSEAFGSNCLRAFYSKFNKIFGLPIQQKPIIKKNLEDYKTIFKYISEKKASFNKLSDRIIDEYKAALRYYLLFLGDMTSRFSTKEVYETCPTKRGSKDISSDVIPAKYFKHGVFDALRKVKCIFPGNGAKTIGLSYDQVFDIMKYAVDQYIQSKGRVDAIEYTSFIMNTTPLDTFDWKSILIDHMEVCANGANIPLMESRWVSFNDDTLIVNTGRDWSEHYQLPVFNFSKSKRLSLAYLPSYKGTIAEHREYMERIYTNALNIQDSITKILPEDSDLLSEERIHSAIMDNTDLFKRLSQEAFELLREYASNFHIELIAE